MAAETRGRTLTRMLIAIFEGDEGRGIVQLPRLIGLARLQNSSVRVAYFRRIPRDRTDRYDRVVADRYREMLRIEEAIREAVTGVLRAAGGVAGERGRQAGGADEGDVGRGGHGAGGAVELGPAQEARLLDALGAESGVQQVLRDPRQGLRSKDRLRHPGRHRPVSRL